MIAAAARSALLTSRFRALRRWPSQARLIDELTGVVER